MVKLKEHKKFFLVLFILIIILLSLVNFENPIKNQIDNLFIKKASEDDDLVTYTVHNVKNGVASILIEINSDDGIEYIVYNEDNKINANGKKTVTIDYSANVGEEYIFKIKEKNKSEVSKIIQVSNPLKCTFDLVSGDSYNMDISITFEDWFGISKIICPDGTEIDCSGENIQETISYSVEQKFGETYSFSVLQNDGIVIQEDIKITTLIHTFTGNEQFQNLEIGNYTFECYGARGGNGYGGSKGGYGGYVCGDININSPETFYLYIGQAGQDGNTRRASYNGGAIGGSDTYLGTENGGSGGGATDIRLLNGQWNDSNSLNSRIMVAGGGRWSWWLEWLQRWSWRIVNRIK